MEYGILGFWVFMSVLVAFDYWVFSQGFNTLLQTHKTPEEKELVNLKIEEARLKVARLKQAMDIK